MNIPYYPMHDFGPAMKGMIIGGLGIFHVFVAQFAIGGGLLMCYFQWLAQTGRSPLARRFLDGYFRFLVLISFVIGAITGVGMWFTSIQISPRTIGLMIDHFHWLWATEWAFFCLEIMSGYLFLRYGPRLTDDARMKLLILYAFAAWMSLFIINGILAFQLTPDGWVQSRSIWAGFFNPSFWPTLVFRTLVAMTIAALIACVVINAMNDWDRAARTKLINRAAHFLAPMALMPFVGVWFLMVIPPDSRSWVLGGSTPMTMFLSITVGASLLLGAYAFIALLAQRLYINGATATLLCALAFGATAGGEFVREGVRKPYTVRQTLYSNSIRPTEVAYLRKVGSVTYDPYPLRDGVRYPPENRQLPLGALVYRFQCSVCHTLDGANPVTHLASSWTPDQMRMNLAKLQHTKPFMPPFAGTPDELEALVQWLRWNIADRPEQWPLTADPAVIAQIGRWLDEAGIAPSGPPVTLTSITEVQP